MNDLNFSLLKHHIYKFSREFPRITITNVEIISEKCVIQIKLLGQTQQDSIIVPCNFGITRTLLKTIHIGMKLISDPFGVSPYIVPKDISGTDKR